MADSATDIDLDSVIDRLLEGGWRVPVTGSSFGSRAEAGGGYAKRHPRRLRRGVLEAGLEVGFRASCRVESSPQHAAVSQCVGVGRWKKSPRADGASLGPALRILTPDYALLSRRKY